MEFLMTLTVENIGLGPRDLPALSICHYGERNGQLRAMGAASDGKPGYPSSV